MSKKDKVINGKSRNRNLNPLIIVVFTILVVYALTVLFMLGWGFMTSLKATSQIDGFNRVMGPDVLGFPNMEYGRLEFEDAFHIFYNYEKVFQVFTFPVNANVFDSQIYGNGIETSTLYQAGIGHFVFNSIFYATGGAFLYALVTMTSGYLCSKYRYKFSYFLYTMLLIIMTIPLVGTQPATIEMLRTLGIYNSYLSMLLTNMNFAGLYFFVFFAYFQGIPDTYMEAAEIDGASQFMIYLRIIIPLASKMMGTVFLIQFITLWNNYENPKLYFQTTPTLADAMYKLSYDTSIGDYVTQAIPGRMAGCMILVIPVLILFLALRNVIMGNITLGGLKE